MARHKSAIRVPQHPGMDSAGIDNYRGVALGVESAWPFFVYGHKGKGANTMRSRIFAALRVALAVAGLAVLTGCALGAADCGPDWHAVGQRDGRLGAQPQAETYARRCGVEVNSASYLRGWQEGFHMRPRPTA